MYATLNKETLKFLRDLTKNNNREWFNENKEKYTAAHENVLSFVEAIIAEIAEFDEEIGRTDAKKSLFRIYRDVRFSKDKSPYKTNFGAGLGMGKGSKISGYYLHIEPGKSFLAGGVYHPEVSVLKEIRKEISENGEEFLQILTEKNFKKNFKELSADDKLVKVPQGFEKENPMAEYLKHKSFVVTYPLDDKDLLDENAAKNISEIFRSIQPLNRFLEAPFL